MMKRQTVIGQMYNIDKLVVEVSPLVAAALTVSREERQENKLETQAIGCV